jgi:hypothetical protein
VDNRRSGEKLVESDTTEDTIKYTPTPLDYFKAAKLAPQTVKVIVKKANDRIELDNCPATE